MTVSEYLEARHSGPISASYVLAYTDPSGNQVTQPVTPIDLFIADLDRVDFNGDPELGLNGKHEGLKAAMFWAIYNETSEGTIEDYKPGGVSCQSDGWRVDATREIIRVIHGDGDPDECHESAYFDVQTMINGILNIDRSIPGQDKDYYTHFSTNFKGSLGNQPPKGSRYTGYPINGVSYESEIGTNTLWMTPGCWPERHPADPDPTTHGLTYREALEGGTDEVVLDWLERYLDCMAQGWQDSGTIKGAHHYNFYDRIYASENSVINVAIRDYENRCFNSQSLINPDNPDESTYAACDPTEGAVERKGASTHTGGLIMAPISNCQGNTPEDARANSDVDAQFGEIMRKLGSPEYGGTPGAYTPDASSILYPVVNYYRPWWKPNYPVESCFWMSNVYQRGANPYFYTR